MKKLLITLTILAMTPFAYAGKATPSTKIIYMYTYDSGAVIRIANKDKNEYECTHSKANEYLVLRYDDKKGKEQYASLLAAYMSDRKIRLAYSGCDTLWGKNTTLPKIYRVDILK